MTSTIDWADWLLNVTLGLAIFAGGSVIVAPDFVYRVTASKPLAEDQQLAADLNRPAISDEALAKMDAALWP